MSKFGHVKNYNQERGFGFISTGEGEKGIFFHRKDFPKGIIPQVGEQLKFEIVQDGNKTKAVNIVRLDYPSEQDVYKQFERLSASSIHRNSNFRDKSVSRRNSIFSTLLTILCLATFAYFAGGYIQNLLHRQKLSNQEVNQQTLRDANRYAVPNETQSFKCDGRIHCSQMNSKAEADWFVKNCPGTKMDGDGDGDACENDSRW